MRANLRQKADFSQLRIDSDPEVERMDVDHDLPEAPPNVEEDVERMDDEENRLKGEETMEIVIEDVDRLDETLYGPIAYIRSLPWRLMVMPKRSHNKVKTLGIFLQCCPNEIDSIIPGTYYCHAIVEFAVKRHLEGQEPFSRRIEHTFCAKENDWGFPAFLQWEDMLNPEEGYLLNGALHITAHIVADAPHGINWDSKHLTGYVGLKNQGATCYMSSLLQTLFFTMKLRKAVYLIPSEMDDLEKSVAFAMQRVFYELQFSDKPVATKKLTKSFGWDTWDSFMQHDVQELCRVLLDNLEQKMIGTVVEGTIPQLFEGRMESYVKCTKVNYTSSRTEPFMDVQLNIKSKKNIFESLDDYVASELLDGDNKYDAGNLGLQEAKKGVIFVKLPPVLNLHLMRFQYDLKTETNVKINDRCEFPVKLDLTKYVKEPEDTPSIYKLFAVLVHSGDYHGGHYVAYLNPGCRGEWFKFDDDVVATCRVSEAVESNYGGSTQESRHILSRTCTSAYMLVYIRESAIDTVLAPVLESDIPTTLVKALAEEKKAEERRRQDKKDDHLYLIVEVFTSDALYSHEGYELFDLQDNNTLSFRFLRTTPIAEVQEEITAQMGYKPGQLRLWHIAARQNATHRPAPFPPDRLNDPIMSLTSSSTPHYCTVFAETEAADLGSDQLPEYDCETDNLLFFKWYNPRTGVLSFVTYFPVPSETIFGDLAPTLCGHVGLPEQTPLLFYEEVAQSVVDLVEPDTVICEKNEFGDGDIICFQKAQDSLLSLGFPKTVKEYFLELDTQIAVTFYDAMALVDNFSLDLSHQLTYSQIASHVGAYLAIDPMCIQFLQPNPARPTAPGHPLRSSFSGSLKDLVSMTTRLKLPNVLFYHKIPMPIDEFETKLEIHCLFIGKGFRETKDLRIYVNADSTVRDVVDAAKKELLTTHGYEVKTTLRVVDVVGARIYNVYSEDGRVDALPISKVLRLEEVPADELSLADDEMLVPVAHFHKEMFQTFGAPFCTRVKDKEPVSTLIERLRARLDLTEKEFEKYKVALIKDGRALYLFENDSDKAISLSDFKPTSSLSYPRSVMGNLPWIGLDHVNRNPKRNRLFLEKAIKIFN